MRSSDDGQRNDVPPPYGNAPYLSVVVAARNDDHGGNLLRRMQIFVDAWISQAKRHKLDSELIIVEWNPTPDRDRLGKALRWPADPGPCQVRIVEVPTELHGCYQHAAALPLYQMIAKNVGIRRARGEFILATNIDIVFSDELIQFLAARRLEKGRLYRIDRHDAMSDVPMDGKLDQQLAYCRTHLLRLCAREGAFPLTAEGFRQNPPNDITSSSGIHFGAGWSPLETYESQEMIRWIHNDAEVVARAPEDGGFLTLEIEPGPGIATLPQLLEAFDNQGVKVAGWSISGRTTIALAVPPARDVRSIRLHLDGGCSPLLTDQRINNLAVFRCDWAAPNQSKSPKPSLLEAAQQNSPTLQRLLGACRQFFGLGGLLSRGSRLLWRALRLLRRRGDDVFERGLDFQAGSGWSYLEEVGGERFRWVSQDARLAIRMPRATSNLALLLEPGPGLGYRPFVLEVRHLHETGKLIARAQVQGLTCLEFSVPAAPGEITTLCLTPDREGSRTGSDPRILNFRVLACGSGAGHRSEEHTDAADSGEWPAVVTGTRPVTRDWVSELEPLRNQLNAMGKPACLHTNACGDFTLLSRELWFDLRGYPELDLFSMHLDSLLCYAAHFAGAQEEILETPMRIYHIEHAIGSGWTPEGNEQLQARIARRGIQFIGNDDLVWLITQMRSLRAPVIFNLPDWGLVEQDLPESSPFVTASAAMSEVGR
jgi:hypothetical protein